MKTKVCRKCGEEKPIDKEKVKKHKRKWTIKNREKVKAENKVHRAIKAGRLIKPEKCENCGIITKLEAHHPDYSQPLKVQFLCMNCHKAEHKKINEKMRKIENGKICSC